jgi:hypothetical protein
LREAADILGNAFQERAETRPDDETRAADWAAALAAYTEAWHATPAGADERLDYAINVANTKVIHAAITGLEVEQVKEVIDEVIHMISKEMNSMEVVQRRTEITKLQKLFPLLLARLKRQHWWADFQRV